MYVAGDWLASDVRLNHYCLDLSSDSARSIDDIGPLRPFARKLKRSIVFLFLSSFWLLTSSWEYAQQLDDINTSLMRCTFRISGPSNKTPGEISYGSGFLVGVPTEPNSVRSWYVFVTAAHILRDIEGNTATIDLRRKNGDGTYSDYPYLFQIRNNFINLYETSPEADVAVAFINLPFAAEVPSPVPVSFLVSDERISQVELHPGDNLFVLGFPLYTSLNTFPVLRSAILSSYPLVPAKTVKHFYLNFRVFPENSGGPVYFDYLGRFYISRNTTDFANRQVGILGLVSNQLSSSASGMDESLDIAEVVPAIYITEAISKLGGHPAPANTILPVSSVKSSHSK